MRILILLIMVSCTLPGYQKAGENGWRLGYSDTKILKNKHRVKYLANESMEAYQWFLLRASEITVKEGYKYFTISDIGDTRDSLQLSLGTQMASVSDSNSQYEATISVSNTEYKESFNAKEILKTVKREKL